MFKLSARSPSLENFVSQSRIGIPIDLSFVLPLPADFMVLASLLDRLNDYRKD
jgi:hypothetical protein